jgi:hypothetical protein
MLKLAGARSLVHGRTVGMHPIKGYLKTNLHERVWTHFGTSLDKVAAVSVEMKDEHIRIGYSFVDKDLRLVD